MNFLDRLSMTTYDEDLDGIHKFTEDDLVELDPEDFDRILVYTFSPIDLKMPKATKYGQDNSDSWGMVRTIEIKPQLGHYPPYITLRQVLEAFIENNKRNNQILKKYMKSGPSHYFYEGMMEYLKKSGVVWWFNRWGS